MVKNLAGGGARPVVYATACKVTFEARDVEAAGTIIPAICICFAAPE